MIPRTKNNSTPELSKVLDPNFSRRLEASLQLADDRRHRRLVWKRIQRWFPLILLVGPIFAWRLILVSTGTAHIAIDAVAWVTYLLDIGVHLDTTLLAYLQLQALPTIVGVLLLVAITVSVLGTARED